MGCFSVFSSWVIEALGPVPKIKLNTYLAKTNNIQRQSRLRVSKIARHLPKYDPEEADSELPVWSVFFLPNLASFGHS